jgi:glycosyltransferase involved in cell wall biosynthesis
MITLKCVFYPHWPSNPYQKLLAEKLKSIGVQVEQTEPHFIILPGLIKDGKPDILHLHALAPLFLSSNTPRSFLRMIISIFQLAILRFIGVRIVWTAHDLKNHANRHIILDRMFTVIVSRLAHAIITHCETAKREVARTFYMKNFDKIYVIPHANYVDTYENDISPSVARRKLGISESKVVLLSLGMIRPYKGVLELIDDFKMISQDGAQLVIAGKPTTSELEELLEQKSAGCQNIKLIPEFIPDEEIQVYMNACDAAVFAFRDIFTSGSVILAMSFGRACIAPRKGCIGDVLDELGAFLYDPDEQKGLLNALISAVRDKTILKDMGQHNLKAIGQWSWSRIAEMTFNVYRSCLGR